EIIELANVLETLQDVNISKPAITDVKAKIQAPGLLDEYAAISEGFIGREEELKELQGFIATMLHNLISRDKTTITIKKDIEGMVITGVGGVGKSTLLAKFTSEVIAQKKKTVVAILDFDRPGINASDPVWLIMEISRQIGIQFPELKEVMTTIMGLGRSNK